jgi:hypothetical protein
VIPKATSNKDLSFPSVDSKHFWTEKDDHTGTKTKVQVTVKSHATAALYFQIKEDVKGHADSWHWDDKKHSWSGQIFDLMDSLAPGETKTFTVTTNTDQGAIAGHVRGVYVTVRSLNGTHTDSGTYVNSGTVDVNMKKVD